MTQLIEREKSIAQALHWLTQQLGDTPYSICGGLAAIAYGSQRDLNDIDLFVPEADFAPLVNQLQPYVSKPAQRYQGEGWDLEYVQLIHAGIKIEAGNPKDAFILNASTHKWQPLNVVFSALSKANLYGNELSVMNKQDLIDYKNVLQREVDIDDVHAIKAAEGKQCQTT
jgi:hypothetical protein